MNYAEIVILKSNFVLQCCLKPLLHVVVFFVERRGDDARDFGSFKNPSGFRSRFAHGAVEAENRASRPPEIWVKQQCQLQQQQKSARQIEASVEIK